MPITNKRTAPQKEKLRRRSGRPHLRPGTVSFALLMTIGGGCAALLDAMFEGRRLTVGRAFEKAMRLKGFWDYYESLERMRKESLRTALWRLEKKGLLQRNRKETRLTTLGRALFKKAAKQQTDQKWDGKWRIVAFDIPEKLRRERDWLRRQLHFLAYMPLQKSVFIGKFPLPEDTFREMQEYHLTDSVRLMTVGEIDDETLLEATHNTS